MFVFPCYSIIAAWQIAPTMQKAMHINGIRTTMLVAHSSISVRETKLVLTCEMCYSKLSDSN